MNDAPGQSATEVATVATIDNKLSSIEIDYALAHRLVDLGRAEKRAQGGNTRSTQRLTICSTASIGSAG